MPPHIQCVKNCYNPKLHQTCIPRIRPSYLLSFPIHHRTNLLKNHFFEGVHALHNYCSRTHACFTTTTHVHSQKSAKNENCKGIWVFGLLPNHLTAHSQSPQPLLSLFPYKRRCWGPIPGRSMRA
jgi:hypothetical protein